MLSIKRVPGTVRCRGRLFPAILLPPKLGFVPKTNQVKIAITKKIRHIQIRIFFHNNNIEHLHKYLLL